MQKILMVLVLLILPAMAIAGPIDDYNKGKAAYNNLNYEEAVRWWRKAANQGHVDAQYVLGLAYRDGDGVAQSDKDTVRWWRKAANQGHVDAQYDLGVSYSKGLLGVLKNDKEAAHWWRKAANQGNAEAQYVLGLLHTIGRGVARDWGLAYKWYLLAAFRGSKHARKEIDIFEKELTERQRNAGQVAAQKWIDKFNARQAEK